MDKIQMVDLKGQYEKIKNEVDAGIQEVIDTTSFIKGQAVKSFELELGKFLGGAEVISCGNGTDALQIALMALDLEPGDEVIVPSFTYIATVEVIALLGLKPVLCEVNNKTFNLAVERLRTCISSKTKAIVPVHLYGQPAPMDEILNIARQNGIYVVEDTAQAIGAKYKGNYTATMGDIGCLSFFPSKNLGCYGDGGALVTTNKSLANKIRSIANHGQYSKYKHDVIGVNSRLDSIQAAVLLAKLPYLESYNLKRKEVATYYNNKFKSIEEIELPFTDESSEHVYHQYTIKVPSNKRDELKNYLLENGIPSMIYYPIPIFKQEGYKRYFAGQSFELTEVLTKCVISLPIHTEMLEEQLEFISKTVLKFFK